MKILVTGGCGFVGTNLCLSLKNKRHSVFSTSDDIIMLVFCMKFDEHLFERLIEQYRFA